MRRDQLEHVIRAAAVLADDPDIVIVGSQAILGTAPDAPADLLRSIEADVFPRTHPERADVVDGAIGEGSIFQDTFGYYAHGVGPETAKAPEGWEERLVLVEGPGTNGARGWCLEPHDLVLAKCVAGREKDLAFARAALAAQLVAGDGLLARIDALPVGAEHREAVRGSIEGLLA
jgi:hypothetical protein